MPPSPLHKKSRRDQSLPLIHQPFFATCRAAPKVCRRAPPAISFFAKVPRPFVPTPRPSLPHMRKRFLLPALPRATERRPERAAPGLQVFHPSLRSVHLSERRRACFQTPVTVRSSPIARSNQQPSQWPSS